MMQSPLSVPTMYDAISPISAYEFEQVSNFSHDAFLLIDDCDMFVLVFWASLLYPGHASDSWSIWFTHCSMVAELKADKIITITAC